jgi:hypothetical protein
MKKVRNPAQIKITGYIIPIDWDKSGYVVQVSIETEDFDRYIVADNLSGRALFNYIDKKVEVLGHIIGEGLNGNEILSVNDFNILG